MQNDTRAEVARLDERIKALDRILIEREKSLLAAQYAAEKSADKAEASQQLINVVSNEWRGTLKDAQNNFPSKPELQALIDRVVNLEKGASAGLGRSGGRDSAQDTLFRILPLLISVITLLALFLRK